jgi:hypothetical protein
VDDQTLKPGWWVALTLHRDAAPLRSYVGKVQQVDDRGVRITMIDWLDGTASDYDLFVPWPSIASAMVATDEQDLTQFEERAGQWHSHSACLGGEYDRDRARQHKGSERIRRRETPKAQD